MATFNLTFYEGLNAVSTPLVLSGSDALWDKILANVAYNSVRTVVNGKWKDHIRGRLSTLNDFNTFDFGAGYIVDVVRLGSAPQVSISFPLGYTIGRVATGDPYYLDSTDPMLDVAPYEQTAITVRTKQADHASTSSTYLTFSADRAGEVAVCYDATATVLPSWLNTWGETHRQIKIGSALFNVFTKTFPSGPITLSGNHAGGGNGSKMYAVLVSENLFPIYVSTPIQYKIIPLDQSFHCYSDITTQVTNLPAEYRGFPWIKFKNSEYSNSSTAYLNFFLPDEAVVYVGYPDEEILLPNWLVGFTQLVDVIETNGVPLRLYKKHFPAGTVTLGGASAATPADPDTPLVPGPHATPSANYIVGVARVNRPSVTIQLEGTTSIGAIGLPLAGVTKGGLSLIGVPKSDTSDLTIASNIDARGIQYRQLMRLNQGVWESYVPTRDALLNWYPADLERGNGYMLISSIDEDQVLEIDYDN